MAKPTLAYLLRLAYSSFEIIDITSYDRNYYYGRTHWYNSRTNGSFHHGVFGVTNDKATVGLWHKAARETYDRETVKVESLRNQLREAEKDRVNAVHAAIEKIGGKIVLGG